MCIYILYIHSIYILKIVKHYIPTKHAENKSLYVYFYIYIKKSIFNIYIKSMYLYTHLYIHIYIDWGIVGTQ